MKTVTTLYAQTQTRLRFDTCDYCSTYCFFIKTLTMDVTNITSGDQTLFHCYVPCSGRTL